MKAERLPSILVVLAVLLASCISTCAAQELKPELPGPEGERAFRELGIYYDDARAGYVSHSRTRTPP